MAHPVTLLAGPTASGKSALALRLAEETGAEIVGADSMQIYAGLDILTAAATAQEKSRVPHHLVSFVDAAEIWSVGRWREAAMAALTIIATRGKPAIVVGGTGLYFRALTHGLADIPQVDRAHSEAEWERLGEAGFRKALAALDPRAEARISSADRQRLLRAHAVAIQTGKALSDWQDETRPALAPGSWTGLVIEPERSRLYDRCDARLEAMVETGALDEVRALMARSLDPDLPAMKAVGLRPLAAYLRGELAREEAIVLAQQETRNYAKRQLTWFRNQTPDWPRVGQIK